MNYSPISGRVAAMKVDYETSTVSIGPGDLWINTPLVVNKAEIQPWPSNCRNCGAPAVVDRSDCEYCRTPFALIELSQFQTIRFYTDESDQRVATRIVARHLNPSNA